jgi:hypothetical protein
VEVPEDPGVRITLVGERVQARPVEGNMEEVRLTVPGKALIEEIVIVEVTAEPALLVTLDGLALIEKSGTLTLNVTVAVWESSPSAPLTVIVYDPGRDAVHDSVEEPEPPAMVVELRLQFMLVDEVVTVRVTVSTKPLAGLTVIVEVSAELTFPVRLVGAASMLKSSIMKAAVVEWERVPLAPVIPRVYVPAMFELQETVAVPELARLPGEIKLQFKPAGIESVRPTVPANPFR